MTITSKYFVHPLADVHSLEIGNDTKIWQFTIVLSKAKIGYDCNICSHVFIENDVIVGNRVTIKNGVHLWDGLRVGDDAFVGPNVTFTNDQFPRSKNFPKHYPTTKICEGASVGGGAVILPGLTIGVKAMVGAGSVVTRDVVAGAVVLGNPARIVRYIEGYGECIEKL